MKIAILAPKTEFTLEQQTKLTSYGEVVYTDSRREYTDEELVKLCGGGSGVIGVDPDNFGGFEKAKSGRLTKLLTSLPQLKCVSLATTSFSWVDLDYCRKRGVTVTNVPHYSTESVAESVLGLLICLAKKIVLSDRRQQKGRYKLEMGFELKGKTLGVIGLGHIGSRVAELGRAIGMRVIAYNRTPKTIEGVEIKTIDEVLVEADAISINLSSNEETKNFLSTEKLSKVKNGVIIVNLATRELVDETAMAEALKSGKVNSYCYEGEDLSSGSLANIENAIGLQCFSWYTREAWNRATEIWVESIVSFLEHRPINVVS